MRYEFGAFQLDDELFALTGPSGPVHVEPQVFEVLHHLLVNRDRVVSKQELLDSIWGHTFVSESALTSRLKSARRAVGDDGTAQRVIRTVHGRGYQFVAEVRVDAGRGHSALPRLRNAPIGRDDDIERVVDRLRAAPLLTLTGPGGMGKTTVAVAAAARLESSYAEGVVFVDLTSVPPQSEVVREVAAAAGVEGTASESADRLAAHLACRPALLVLDNCEHVLAAVARLVDRMLELGATIDVLATSREPLGIGGEHLWPVGSLDVEAPTLFVERARAAEPRVDWAADDAAVVELCRRLDHVPLAIELAAGQLRRFDLAELLGRLDDRLGIGWGQGGDDAERHASMETAIDWSYRLLEPQEQRLLHQLSTFPSTFDLRAVEGSAPELGTDPVEVFGQLVDKSLVVREPGSGRYRLLETIRVFARDRLDESGERAEALERHRSLVLRRVLACARIDRWLSGSLAARLRTDVADVRQAFGASMASGAVDDALELAIGMSFLWRQTIGVAEGDAWLDQVEAADLPPGELLWTRILRADIGQGRGDPRPMFGATSGVEVGPGADPVAACVAAHYAALAHLTDPERSHDALAPARALAERSGDPRLVVLLDTYAVVADLAAGRVDQAAAAATALAPAASDDGYEAYMLNWAGWMTALAAQDAEAAWRWMGRQQDYLDRTGIGDTWLTSLSASMCDAVDGGGVPSSLAHALTLADREGYRAEPDCLLVAAYAEICAGRFDEAAEHVGTAMHERFNATAHYVLYRAVLDRPLREALDDQQLATAMRRGWARTAADALAAVGIARTGT